MTTDIVLDDTEIVVKGGNRTYLRSDLVIAEALDIHLNHPERRSEEGRSPWRRALVHAPGDHLTINYGNDYPQGVLIEGPIRLRGGIRINGEIAFEGGPISFRNEAPVVPDITIAPPPVVVMGSSGPVFHIPEPYSLTELVKSMQLRINELEARITALE